MYDTRRALLTGLIVLLVSTASWAAERKPLAEVRVDKLIVETQGAAEPTPGMNLVWMIGTEFWGATFAQDDSVSEADAKQVLEQLGDYLILAVVRADVSPFGAFTFHPAPDVLGSMTVTYAPEGGGSRTLVPAEKVNPDAQLLMKMMTPVLEQSMGAMGANFHFFLYDAYDKKGKRIVSPYEAGRLTVALAQLSNEVGGMVYFDMPFDSLHISRTCAECGREAHISWRFCPMCSKELSD